MAAPVGTATLNQAAYAVGDAIRLTVVYSDPDAKQGTATVVLTDAEGATSHLVATFQVADPVTITVSDDGARTWAKVSDDGKTAVFTAVA